MQPSHVQQLRFGREGIAVVVVVSEHNVIDTHLLGDSQQRRSRQLCVGGNPDSVEGIQAILAADYEDRGRLHALSEHLRKGFTDPL